MKTADLIGPALDWAVAMALGHATKLRTWVELTDALDPVEDKDIIDFHRERQTVRVSSEAFPGSGWYPCPKFSSDWSQGGPIIEREKIDCIADPNGKDVWMGQLYAARLGGNKVVRSFGPTPLVAAMRCFVASKLGDEVDIPKELL